MSCYNYFIRSLFITLLFFPAFAALSQENTYKITGKVVDENLNPIASATVSLHDAQQKKLSSTMTNNEGNFMLPYIKSDKNLFIKVQHLAFKPFQYAITDIKSSKLDTIRLSNLDNIINEVEVNAKPKLIEINGGTVIYNVENTIMGQDVSVLDALKLTPGVYVENEDNISLNGKGGVQILIDGRPTNLSGKELTDLLKSLSSNLIKSIEIINSPTAKFDASGSAGIINIKTKKNQIVGLNGNISSTIAYGISPKQLQNILLNYRVNKINVFGSYNHTLGNYNYIYGSKRIQNGRSFDSHTDDIDKRQKMSTRFGIDYFLNEKSTIGFLANGNFINGGGITDTKTDIITLPSSIIDETLDAINDYYGQGTSRYTFNFNYKYEDTLGHILNIDADYGSFDKWNKNLQSNTYRDPEGSIIKDNLYRTLNGIAINMKGVKIDYSTKLWKGTLETGLKYAQVNSDNDSRFFHVFENYDSLDNRRSNNFKYNENISSAYLDYKRTLNKWSFQAGLRLESANSKNLLISNADNIEQDNTAKMNFTNLFPFFSIQSKLSKNQNISLSYAKRIERPAYQDLNPFIYMLDELSFWQGNPYLRPELTHRLTLMYSLKNSTIVTFNFSYADQFNAKVTDTLEVEKIVMISRNVGTQKHWSLAMTQNVAATPWWNLSFNGLLYFIQNNVSFDTYRNLDLQQLAGRLSVTQSFQMPLKMKAEILFFYNSKRLSGANTFSRATSQVDIGVQKPLFKDKASVRLAVSDIYKGNQSRSTQNFPGFESSSYGYYESRQIRLSLSYKFSRGESKAQRVRNSALENESGRIK